MLQVNCENEINFYILSELNKKNKYKIYKQIAKRRAKRNIHSVQQDGICIILYSQQFYNR